MFTTQTQAQKTSTQVGTYPNPKTKDELIPAEVNAQMERKGDEFFQSPHPKGATVDQEGLNNNYAVEPEEYFTQPPAVYEVRQYLIQGLVASAFVGGLVLIAFYVH
jgi:hypothetical protein